MTLRQTANGKNETFTSVFSCLYSENILYLRRIVGDIFLFFCDLFKDYKERIKNS